MISGNRARDVEEHLDRLTSIPAVVGLVVIEKSAISNRVPFTSQGCPGCTMWSRCSFATSTSERVRRSTPSLSKLDKSLMMSATASPAT